MSIDIKDLYFIANAPPNNDKAVHIAFLFLKDLNI